MDIDPLVLPPAVRASMYSQMELGRQVPLAVSCASPSPDGIAASPTTGSSPATKSSSIHPAYAM